MSMSGVATNSAQSRIGSADSEFSRQKCSELSYVEFETATISTSDVFSERRQMAGAHDVARSDDSDPQFVIIFVH